MPNTPHDPRIDLQEVTNRNRTAQAIIEVLSAASLAPHQVLRHLETALADTPALTAEVTRLRTALAGARLDRANLAAAAKATIAAHHDGEPDPLAYLRDELDAQGYRTDRDRR